MSSKLLPGTAFPKIELQSTDGTTINLSATGKSKLVVIYRGQFCPFCQSKYLFSCFNFNCLTKNDNFTHAMEFVFQ
jgi:peroxiredoxin